MKIGCVKRIYTPTKKSMETENGEMAKEIRNGNHHFLVLGDVFRGVYPVEYMTSSGQSIAGARW